METTERVVESYCRYVKKWFTIPNIKCEGQYEIDLLAVDIKPDQEIKRYHIECGVSISGSFSKLTTNSFSTELLKQRVHAAGQRRTLGYFVERKFGVPEVARRLKEFGFEGNNYHKIIATWDATDDARLKAREHGIEIWDFPDLLRAIAGEHGEGKQYFTDDTVRTLQLYAKAMKIEK